MKSCIFFSFLAVFAVGCASTVPLAAVPQAKAASVNVECAPRTNAAIVFSTARGRNARQDSGSAGLIGMSVAAMIGSDEEAKGKELFKKEIGIDLESEVRLLAEATRTRLAQSGFLLATNAAATNRLVLQIDSIGLRETQKGCWSPFLQVTARFQSDNNVLWKTFVTSTGSHLRHVNEFTRNSGLYQDDSRELVDDVARQLVDGPIRR